MERERPEYLQPIPRTRWEFPWLGMWAVLLLGMAGAGIWLHLKTGDAWNARFQRHETPSIITQQTIATEPTTAEAEKQVRLNEMRLRQMAAAEIRERRERAEIEAKMIDARLREVAAERAAAGRSNPANKDEYRCINGIAFRRIPGGWENVPNAPCP